MAFDTDTIRILKRRLSLADRVELSARDAAQLIILAGLPRSGKSTEGRYYAQEGYSVLDVDEVRKGYASIGKYRWPYDERNENLVREATAVAARVLIAAHVKVVLIDHSIFATPIRAAKMIAGCLPPKRTTKVYLEEKDTPPTVCISRCTAENAYLVPVIMAGVLRTMSRASPQAGSVKWLDAARLALDTAEQFDKMAESMQEKRDV